jgi:uncharacterized protein (TIGR04168 family)
VSECFHSRRRPLPFAPNPRWLHICEVTKPARDTSPVRPQADCIALIGDVHSAWTPEDTAFFNASKYPLLLVTGDLGGSRARDGLTIARSMAALTRRTLVMPGNNDVKEYARISAELTYRHARQELLDGTPGEGPRTCGYSAHELRVGAVDLTIISGRPFAMGGCELSFPDELERSFGVASLEASAERLCAIVDETTTENLVFFAHNGPWGLGSDPAAPWGRDFDPAAGDWGDRDLREAIDYAVSRKRRPLAVLAGHMHWSLRSGGQRRWQLQQDGILYVNAARVPRVFEHDAGCAHQHVALSFTEDGAHAQEVLIPGPRLSQLPG